jgi:hypothetical protein
MTALAKIHQPVTQIGPDPLEVFRLRAWARATLYQAGELDLLDAVDVLQADAESGGLVAALGQDWIQSILAAAFAGAEVDL